MKKLISFSYFLLVSALAIATASPLPLLIPFVPQMNVVLGVSDSDLSAIATYAANNQTALIASLINGLDIANDVMVYPGVKNKIPMPKLAVGNGFRPYSPTEEYKNKNLKYTDRTLEVKVGKRELQIDPEDYAPTYFAWLNSPGSPAGKKEIPFEQFMWSQVIKAMQREMNDETAYKGFDGSATAVWNNGAVYHAGDIVTFVSATNNPNNVKDWYLCLATTVAAESPDTTPLKWQYVTARAVCPGLESYILTGIGASEIAPVATGAITSTGGVAIAAFNKLFRAWSSPYRNNGIIISASQTDVDLLIDDILTTYSKYTRAELTNMPYIVLPNSNGQCKVKLATWLGSSRRLISGPSLPGDANGRHMNLYMGTDLQSDANQLQVLTNSKLWTVIAGMKTRIGFNYQDPNGIKVGDQS